MAIEAKCNAVYFQLHIILTRIVLPVEFIRTYDNAALIVHSEQLPFSDMHYSELFSTSPMNLSPSRF